MPVPQVSDLRLRFAVAAEIGEDRIQFGLDKAGRKIRRKVGIEAFNEIFDIEPPTVVDSEYLDTNTTADDEIALRAGEVTDAYYYYAMADIVLNANLRLRASGSVKKEQDAGSPSMQRANAIDNEYLSTAEVMQWANELNGRADALIAPYVVLQEPANRNAWGRSLRA